MEKSKILVVDDEPLNVELLEGILSEDYEVVRAYDGNEALSKVEKASPDLILLDILLTDMNGYDVCMHIKENNKTMAIPIVMLTVLKEKEERIKAIKAGADDFLIKPIDIDILSARVKSLLKVKQYYDTIIPVHKPKHLINMNHLLLSPQDSMIDNGNIRGVLNAGSPLLDIYPPTEDIVKNHLEIIILKLLSDRPMCGYDLIKEIFEKYNVLLSQGTVYPFLYSLKKDGIVHIGFMKGNMRTKIYLVTPEGKQIIERRINEFINAEEFILNSIKTREGKRECKGV
ncbi:Chemotaxis protein CheY [uncultured archaeon]|nr:Chemotaxis protein CheY [uncultured archaeon]